MDETYIEEPVLSISDNSEIDSSITDSIPLSDNSSSSDVVSVDELLDRLNNNLTDNDESENEPVEGSSVNQTVIDDNGDAVVFNLNVNDLNTMADMYIEQSLASVNVGSNDYFDFIQSPIYDYFSDFMANYPLNEYCAYHQRHWVQNSQYYSYYDDYYYLFYNLPSSDYLEIVRYNGQSNYNVSFGSGGTIASSPIMYGSAQGQSDLRKGVSYVQEMSFLCSIACVGVIFIVSAFFKHLAK